MGIVVDRTASFHHRLNIFLWRNILIDSFTLIGACKIKLQTRKLAMMKAKAKKRRRLRLVSAGAQTGSSAVR
jgi:hypothetical protein